MNENQNNVPQGEASGAWTFLGFCIPLVGLILYCSCKSKLPSVSHKAGKGALIGVIVSAALYVISFVLGLAAGLA